MLIAIWILINKKNKSWHSFLVWTWQNWFPGKKFLVRRGLDVTIEKNGKSALQVTSLFIEADGVTTNPKVKWASHVLRYCRQTICLLRHELFTLRWAIRDPQQLLLRLMPQCPNSPSTLLQPHQSNSAQLSTKHIAIEIHAKNKQRQHLSYDRRTHVPRCPCYVTIHLKSNFVIFILYHVIMIIIVAWIFAGLLKGLNVGDSQWRRTRPSPRQTFVAPDHTAMRGSRRSKWQLGRMEPTVWHPDQIKISSVSTFIRWCPSWVLLWCRLCVLSYQAEHSPPRRLEQKWRRTVGGVGSWTLQDHSVQGWIR